MKSILSITDRAINQLEKIIQNAPFDSDAILLSVEKSGCSGYSYKLDFAKNSNVKKFDYIEQKNIKVFIDPKATMFLIGTEMDYSQDKLSSRFVFNNPNEKSTCGCGESFSV